MQTSVREQKRHSSDTRVRQQSASGASTLRCPPLLSLLLLRCLLDRSRSPTASGIPTTPILAARRPRCAAPAAAPESRRRLRMVFRVEEQSHDVLLVDGGSPGGAPQYKGRAGGEIAAPRRDQQRFLPAHLRFA